MSNCTALISNTNNNCMEPIKEEPVKIRKFGGKLLFGKDACANKKQANIQKKHLKSYLKGEKFFTHGRDNAGDPKQYHVNERWITE